MAKADEPPVSLQSVAGPELLEAIDTLGFGAILMSGDLEILDVSPRVEALLGMRADHLRALTDPASLMVTEQRHLVAERRARLARGDYGQLLDEVELLAAEGERIPVQVSSSAVTVPGQRPGLLVLCRDLRPTMAIDSSLTRLTTLAEVMPVGLIVWDGQGVADPMAMRLAGANGGAERMLGVTLAGRLGATVRELFPDANPVATARLLALTGTERIEDFGDAQYGAGLLRWHATGLPGDAVGVIFEDVSHERQVEGERRALLERLVDTGDAERRRLAVAMHDDPVQKIAAATLLVEAMRRHPDAEPAGVRLEAIEGTLRSAMAALRQLTFELSPPELAESGLEAALNSASDYLFEGTGVSVELVIDLSAEPGPAVQTAAFRIIAEALTNVRKHAEATSVTVTVAEDDGTLVLSVVDDGVGMEHRDEHQPGHIGLRAMRERTSAVGGTLRVTSAGQGVRVEASLPLDARSEARSAEIDVVPPPPPPPESGEAEIVRRERDSLRIAVGEALDRARVAEGRLQHAVGVTKAMLEPGLSREQIATVAVEHIGRAMRDGCALHLAELGGAGPAAAWHVDPGHEPAMDAMLLNAGIDSGHIGTVLRSGEGLLLDAASLEEASQLSGTARAPHSAIVAPLKHDGAVIGVVTAVRDCTEVPYDVDDVDFLMCLVDRVAVALSMASPASA